VHRTGLGPTNVDDLLGELAEVRSCGFAHEDQMVTPGISCIGAPVLSHEGFVVAAVGVTYVSAQRDPADVAQLAELVRQMAARLSTNLGHRPTLERVA
jgi:DNA-binding IclR family transcriptional regulator